MKLGTQKVNLYFVDYDGKIIAEDVSEIFDELIHDPLSVSSVLTCMRFIVRSLSVVERVGS